MDLTAAPDRRTISVFLADDNLIVREGVRALIERSPDLSVVGLAADYDEVVSGCTATEILPLSAAPAYFEPFWLSPGHALVAR